VHRLSIRGGAVGFTSGDSLHHTADEIAFHRANLAALVAGGIASSAAAEYVGAEMTEEFAKSAEVILIKTLARGYSFNTVHGR